MDVGASVHASTVPTMFPFQRLPMEVQHLMLQHLLVSPIPILNAGVPPDKQKYLVKGEQNGLDQLSPHILFTCKLYYTEGLPLLYGRNTFMYTDPWAFHQPLAQYKKRRTQTNSWSPGPMTENQPPHDPNVALAHHTVPSPSPAPQLPCPAPHRQTASWPLPAFDDFFFNPQNPYTSTRWIFRKEVFFPSGTAMTIITTGTNRDALD